MQHTGNNKGKAPIVEVDWELEDFYRQSIPKYIVDFVIEKGVVSYSLLNIWEFYTHNQPFVTWPEVFQMLKEQNSVDHRDVFGGVHPQFDTPRRVW